VMQKIWPGGFGCCTHRAIHDVHLRLLSGEGVRGDAERYNESLQRCYKGEFGLVAGGQCICRSVAPCT
jgi:hypothetical protein